MNIQMEWLKFVFRITAVRNTSVVTDCQCTSSEPCVRAFSVFPFAIKINYLTH
jgi:hypothetical protein